MRRLAVFAVALLAAFLALPACERAAGTASEDGLPVVLLTAFEPFGGASVNASWEAVKGFEGAKISGHRVRARRLPVVYDEVEGPLAAAIAETKPVVVISFGVGTRVVQVERLARNGYHPSRPRDEAGRAPPREKIRPDGPDTVPTALPVDAILRALEKARIGATDSDDAGGFLCNECFYRLMTRPPAEAPAMGRRGFVHVPEIGARNPLGGRYDLPTLEKAVRIVVETTLSKADPAVR